MAQRSNAPAGLKKPPSRLSLLGASSLQSLESSRSRPAAVGVNLSAAASAGLSLSGLSLGGHRQPAISAPGRAPAAIIERSMTMQISASELSVGGLSLGGPRQPAITAPVPSLSQSLPTIAAAGPARPATHTMQKAADPFETFEPSLEEEVDLPPPGQWVLAPGVDLVHAAPPVVPTPRAAAGAAPPRKPTRMSRAKTWSPEIENTFRLQETGWASIEEYLDFFGEPERWPNGLLRVLRYKETGFWSYWDETRQCEDKMLNRIKIYYYD
jgi:hypothetical protein